MPSWAARIAATSPRGPEPMTIVSKEVSGMALTLGHAPRRHLDARHRPDELPEQEPGAPDHDEADDERRDVRRGEQREEEDEDDQRQQRLEAEHRPVAHAPDPDGGRTHQHAEGEDADDAGPLAVELDAGEP